MSEVSFVTLPDRGILAVSGQDRVAFLQGLISNDVEKVSSDRAIYAAFLTPQGKYIFDFMVIGDGDRILLDCEAERIADLAKRLRIYKLRSKVEFNDVSDVYAIHAVHGVASSSKFSLPPEAGSARGLAGGVALVDPRLSSFGVRLILPRHVAPTGLGLVEGNWEAHDRLRISLGIPDGSRDMLVDKTVLLEAGFDELNGVDWEKGCYMGQELTARTKYRGLVKRRLMPVLVDGPMPAPGTPVMAGAREAGEIRSGAGDTALAMIRLNMLKDGGPLAAGGVAVRPIKPNWAAF
ncbi:MAG: glycine cleavage system protein T [Rhodospirillaceae bacterium]|nr:glycine cleavage system protein T [Rhodospirillaceae bacterium]